MLNINKTVEEAKAVVALEGRLDTVTAPELESDLMGIIEGIEELVISPPQVCACCFLHRK